MNMIRAFLIHEVRGFDASFQLLTEALGHAGFTVCHVGGQPDPKAAPWTGKLRKTTLFLSSLLFKDYVLTPAEVTRWAEHIKDALDNGAGLVAMLDESTVPVINQLKTFGVVLPLAMQYQVQNPPLIFRPVLTEAGKRHVATKALIDHTLPPFGSLPRSHYRTIDQSGAKVLMEIPAHDGAGPFPFLAVTKSAHNAPRIALLAADWCNTAGQQFIRWPDASIMLAGIGRWAAGVRVNARPHPIAAKPEHWFLKYDRQQTIESWQEIKDKLSAPKVVETTPITGAVRTIIVSGPTTELTCRDEPSIVQGNEPDQETLEVRLCNGIVVRLKKATMRVGYSLERPDGSKLVLAEEPTGSTYAPLFWQGETAVYAGCQVVGANLEVKYALQKADSTAPCGHLYWTFIPAEKVIEGVRWTCVGEQFALMTEASVTTFDPHPHRWQLGETIEGHSTCRFACYPPNGRPRGFRRIQFNKECEEQGDLFYWFCDGQPFQMLNYESEDKGVGRTLWCYTATAAAVKSEVRKLSNEETIAFVHRVELGRQTGNVQLPTFWYCFAEQGFSHNLWLTAYDHVRQHFRQEFGIERSYPRPTAMLRYHFTYLNELRHYADAFVPLAKALGFKRIECGVRFVNDLFFPLHGGIDALRYLCDKAHAAGIEVIFYCGASWVHDGHPKLGSVYIDDSWRIKTPDLAYGLWKNPKDGTECHDLDGLKRRIVLVSLRSGWYGCSLKLYHDLKNATGVDGVWLDSWTIPNKYVNYAEPSPAPAVVEAMRYVADLQKLGYLVLVEGQSPVALESFWYQTPPYVPLRSDEFTVSGMAPFASNDDGLLTDDLFRLLAYGCAMFQDIRLLADENDAVTKVARTCNMLMNTIHEKLGPPLRVRELPVPAINDKSPIDPPQTCEERAKSSAVATFWECEKGFAIFGLRTAQQLSIKLPTSMQYQILEQRDTRPEQGTTAMTLRNDGNATYLEGQLVIGGVVLLSANKDTGATDTYLPIIQR